MTQHEAMVAPEKEERAKLQIALPAWVWRQTKSLAPLRSMSAQDLVAQALISHLGLTKEEAPRPKGGKRRAA